MNVKIATIQIKERARALNDSWVEILAGMIAASGLIHPIRLWKDDDGIIWLVAGYHRLAAHTLLEHKEVPATFSPAESWEQARLEELLENLGRNELSALYRAQHLFELKEAYETLHPETKKGGDKQTQEAREKLSGIIPFRSDAAEKTGLSESAISKAVAMWKGLSKDTKQQVRGSWVEDHQACLLALSKQSAHLQKKALPFLLDGRAKNVDDALVLAANRKLPGAMERKFAGIRKSLKSLDDGDLFMVFDGFEDKIEAWLKDRGREGGRG